MDYYDEQLNPAPDHHGESPYPIDSSDVVSPYGDQHGMDVYPQNNSGDVHPQADSHTNEGFNLHKGQPKPGSFKD